jgi:hypothetical protein
VDRRSGEGCGKPLDEGSTGLIVVENLGESLCPAVDVSAEMMMMIRYFIKCIAMCPFTNFVSWSVIIIIKTD